MNTIDRITKALENASPELVEAVAANLGIATHVRPADVTAAAVSEWLVWGHMQDLTYDLLSPQSATDSIHKSISVVARDVLGLVRARGRTSPVSGLTGPATNERRGGWPGRLRTCLTGT